MSQALVECRDPFSRMHDQGFSLGQPGGGMYPEGRVIRIHDWPGYQEWRPDWSVLLKPVDHEYLRTVHRADYGLVAVLNQYGLGPDGFCQLVRRAEIAAEENEGPTPFILVEGDLQSRIPVPITIRHLYGFGSVLVADVDPCWRHDVLVAFPSQDITGWPETHVSSQIRLLRVVSPYGREQAVLDETRDNVKASLRRGVECLDRHSLDQGLTIWEHLGVLYAFNDQLAFVNSGLTVRRLSSG